MSIVTNKDYTSVVIIYKWLTVWNVKIPGKEGVTMITPSMAGDATTQQEKEWVFSINTA